MLLTVENAKGGTGRCWREKVTNLDLDLWVRVSVGRLAGDAPMLSDVGSRGRVGGASGVRCSSLSSFFGHMLLVCVVQDLSSLIRQMGKQCLSCRVVMRIGENRY